MNLWLDDGGQPVSDASSSRIKSRKKNITNERVENSKAQNRSREISSDIYQMPARKPEIPPRFHGSAVL